MLSFSYLFEFGDVLAGVFDAEHASNDGIQQQMERMETLRSQVPNTTQVSNINNGMHNLATYYAHRNGFKDLDDMTAWWKKIFPAWTPWGEQQLVGRLGQEALENQNSIHQNAQEINRIQTNAEAANDMINRAKNNWSTMSMAGMTTLGAGLGAAGLYGYNKLMQRKNKYNF